METQVCQIEMLFMSWASDQFGKGDPEERPISLSQQVSLDVSPSSFIISRHSIAVAVTTFAIGPIMGVTDAKSAHWKQDAKRERSFSNFL